MANVKTFSKTKDGNQNITKNFKVKEFACHDGSDKILIDFELVCLLQYMRDIVNVPLIINSGYRTEAWNKKQGGASRSYHLYGQAFDVSGASVNTLCRIANSIGIKGIIQYSAFVHIDTRTSKYHADSNGKLLSYGTYKLPYMQELLKKGSNSYKVGVLQFRLNICGYNCGQVDGIFGANTYNALVKFQKKHGLSADGIYGPDSHKKLF